MKIKPLAALLTVLGPLFLLEVSCSTAPGPTQPGPTKLSASYVNWKHFSDIKDRFDWTEEGELAIVKEIEASLQEDAKVYVPNGDRLSMTINDIHLAGEYEPSVTQRRIINGTLPPRFDFDYSLTDSLGKVIKSGHENLTDADFQSHIPMNAGDPLHYEKDMMSTWMQQTMYGVSHPK